MADQGSKCIQTERSTDTVCFGGSLRLHYHLSHQMMCATGYMSYAEAQDELEELPQ